jgi:L-iditol 2-dehydrogenase
MKAAVLHGARDLRYEQFPDPEPGPDDVVVQPACNGLCGSDLHFYTRGELGPFRVTKPYIPGHEASAVVLRAASSGEGPVAGTRVAIEPGIPCRRCEWCKGGRYNLCPRVVFLSAPPVNGTLAQMVALPWDFVHVLPEGVDMEAGAFAEPISVAVQACRRGAVRSGTDITILGAGPIGLVTLLVARAHGISSSVVVDVLESRTRLAAELGASHALQWGPDLAAEIMEITRGRGTDAVIDTTGSAAASAAAPTLARRGGTVVQVGWPESPSVCYPIETLIERELDLVGVNRYCNTYSAALQMLASGLVDPRPLVSHRFAFAEVVSAVEFAATHRQETMKVLVDSGSA